MRLLVDMDGVIYDWVGAYLRLYREFSGEDLPPDFRWEWYFMRQLPNARAKGKVSRSPRLWTEGDAYPGALVTLRELCLTHDTYIATHPGPHPEVGVSGKVEWLKRVAPWFDLERLICIKPKYLLQADALIEDHTVNLVSWKETNPKGIAILMARPWNFADRFNLSGYNVSGIPGVLERIGAGVVDNLAEAARVLDSCEVRGQLTDSR